MHFCNIAEHRLTACPRFIPMESDTPSIFSGDRIIKNCTCSLIYQITVMIPHDYLFISQSFFVHDWSQVILQKISFFFSGKNARFPSLCSHRFILYRNTPDRNSFFFVSFNKFSKIGCP